VLPQGPPPYQSYKRFNLQEQCTTGELRQFAVQAAAVVIMLRQFSTITVCPDQLESNNTLSAAKAISIGVNILAQIASGTDLDYYSFSNSALQSNINLSLSNLPANYDMKLFSPAGTLLATSQKRRYK
jgi:hypothetical protein